MTNKIIVTFDHSQEDIPVLLVGHECTNYYGLIGSAPEIRIDNMITGKEAVDLWDRLNYKKEK